MTATAQILDLFRRVENAEFFCRHYRQLLDKAQARLAELEKAKPTIDPDLEKAAHRVAVAAGLEAPNQGPMVHVHIDGPSVTTTAGARALGAALLKGLKPTYPPVPGDRIRLTRDGAVPRWPEIKAGATGTVISGPSIDASLVLRSLIQFDMLPKPYPLYADFSALEREESKDNAQLHRAWIDGITHDAKEEERKRIAAFLGSSHHFSVVRFTPAGALGEDSLPYSEILAALEPPPW